MAATQNASAAERTAAISVHLLPEEHVRLAAVPFPSSSPGALPLQELAKQGLALLGAGSDDVVRR